MDHRQTAEFFAIAAPGLECACAAELAALGLAEVAAVTGGAAWRGRLADLYRASLHARIASRLVVRLGTFRCRDFPELYRRAARLPWGAFLRPGTPLRCRVTCRTSRLMHTERVEATLREAAGQALGAPAPDAAEGGQLILARIVDDLVELSVDCSGELLHRRGQRTSVAAAPLRETLAAGVLALLGWHGDRPLADPLCGTGTLLLEGALLATGRAPGLEREFAFMHWPGWRPGLWAELCREARAAEQPCPVEITGSDAAAESLAAARANLERAGLAELVTLRHAPLAELPVQPGGGLAVCNPPYGKRLAAGTDLAAWYARFGRDLRHAYPDRQLAFLCPDPALAKVTGLHLRELALLNNGGLRVGLYTT